MRLRPDDDVYRVRAVWLGPHGLTLPWSARYLAYGIWLLMFGLILLVEWISPLDVGVPPVWEVALAVLATYWVMGFVDHERPPASVVQLVRNEVTAPRTAAAMRPVRPSVERVRVRERADVAPQE